jgi:hypothetical protein
VSGADRWVPLQDVGPWQLHGFVLGPLGLMAAEVFTGPGAGVLALQGLMVWAVVRGSRVAVLLAKRARTGR